MSVNLYAGNNTILVELTGLTNDRTDAEINDATVECTITVTRTGEEVTGETWPVVMDAVGSGGDYQATISADSDIDAGVEYTITIAITSGTNLAEFSETVRAKARGLTCD